MAPDPRKATKWQWRGNGERLRSLDAKGCSKASLTYDEQRERARIIEWFANHDEPKPRSEG